MADRQLLEDAARAAGHANGIYGELSGDAPVMYFQTIGIWDPLGDDGDSRRLQVACDLAVIPYPIYAKPKHSVMVKRYEDSLAVYRGEVQEIATIENYGADQYAATRRAITRAAAEIGKQMREAGNG